MAIQWYPGHMHKAQKEIAKIMPQIDLVIEVLDARIPYSSENPMVAALRGEKPCIKLLNKRDLADPVITEQWINYLEQEKGVKALAVTTHNSHEIQQLKALCHTLVPNRQAAGKQIRALIMGIPNVGKSTCINILAERIIAKTGNEPAVTKAQQRIKIDDTIVLTDTPGMLWPKVENENSGYRLAATGAVKDTAMDSDDVAFFLADYLINAYPAALSSRYELDPLPQTELELLEAIGRKRGCLRSGGMVELNKVSDILLNEFRAATIAPITLETPAMIEAEEVVVAEQRLAREAKKTERQQQRKRRKR